MKLSSYINAVGKDCRARPVDHAAVGTAACTYSYRTFITPYSVRIVKSIPGFRTQRELNKDDVLAIECKCSGGNVNEAREYFSIEAQTSEGWSLFCAT